MLTLTPLHWDWETYSTCDLTLEGLDNYAHHPSTNIWVGAYKFGDEPVQLWHPGDPCPPRVIEHVKAGRELWGHGVIFEITIWNAIAVPRYGFFVLHPEQIRCTSELSYAAGLPGSLAAAAPAAGIDAVKDSAGYNLMMQMCRPRGYEACRLCGAFLRSCEICFGTGECPLWYSPLEYPEMHRKLDSYCIQDVVCEHGLYSRLLKLSSTELRYSLMSHQINQRGITIDQPSVRAAQALVVIEKARLNQQIHNITQGKVPKTTMRARMMRWLEANGAPLESLQKADVGDALDDVTLKSIVRAALETWKEGVKTSVAKLVPMSTKASRRDGRLRGAVQFSGAHTRRWAGRAVQYQNLPRGTLHLSPEDVEQVFTWLNTLPSELAAEYIGTVYGSPMQVLSDCLRGFLAAAPGHELFSLDLAQIEARGLAWLASDEAALHAFRTHGKIYEMEAARLFGCRFEDIAKDDPRRQAGKVASLAFQFGGGVNAGQRMGKAYGMKKTDEEWETLKMLYRDSHPEIVAYWEELEEAAMRAVLTPGARTAAGPAGRQIVFRVNGSFLLCKLPSAGVMLYPYPEVRNVMMPWGKRKDTLTYKINKNKQFVRVTTWGGKLAENVTQSLCRDVFAEGMLRLEDAAFPIVVHNHDEAVLEHEEGLSDGYRETAVRIFARVPVWAPDLPIAVSTWRGKRYRKE